MSHTHLVGTNSLARFTSIVFLPPDAVSIWRNAIGRFRLHRSDVSINEWNVCVGRTPTRHRSSGQPMNCRGNPNLCFCTESRLQQAVSSVVLLREDNSQPPSVHRNTLSSDGADCVRRDSAVIASTFIRAVTIPNIKSNILYLYSFSGRYAWHVLWLLQSSPPSIPFEYYQPTARPVEEGRYIACRCLFEYGVPG